MTAARRHDRLEVKVTPGASRTEITGAADGILHVKVAAPPARGRANRELIDFLSRTLGVGRSAVAIVRGQTARRKIIEVAGMGREEVLRRLQAGK
jgi:uncharacterized protein (TIGR00251 family)